MLALCSHGPRVPDASFTHLYITEQILLDDGNAAEKLCVLVLPVLMKFIEAHAWLSVHEKRQPHSVLPRSEGLSLRFLFVCHGGQWLFPVLFSLLGCFMKCRKWE